MPIAILAAAAIWLAPWLHEMVSKEVRSWATLGALLVGLTPYLVWELFFPPPFDLTAYTDTVDYEFKDPGYALEFINRNRENLLAMCDAADDEHESPAEID